ncbi:MAG: hypothetical protein LW688_10950 [Cryomorphaceae bacterium]|jgi:hypothetical protein|nr:hypothetical protein [Cryomorphaceae bacterium]
MKKKIKLYTYGAWSFVFLGFAIIIFGVYIECYTSYKLSLNELGDFYAGTVTAFFSLAGIFLIAAAIKQQELSINNQIKEIELLKAQRFEDTFFNLLENHHLITRPKKNDSEDFFRDLLNKIVENILGKGEAEARKAWDKIESDEETGRLSMYLKSIFHILNYIYSQKGNSHLKKIHANMLRASLGKHETMIVYCHCMGSLGSERRDNWTKERKTFRELVLEFDFLGDVDKTHAIFKVFGELKP